MTKLEKMLKYVSEHNDFYKNRIKEYGIKDPLDITQWPVLTRKELQENRYNMFSDGYKSKYLCHQLIRTTSSGTSGVPINVYWDKGDYWKSMMPLWRERKQWYGISPSDKKVAFTLSHTNSINEYHNVVCLENEHQLLINAASLVTEEAYHTVIKLIFNFQPKWLYVQPFILEQLLYCYKKNGFEYPRSLIHIDSVGEILTDQLKNEALNFFKISLANLYGSEEHNGIAYECPYGHMHIIDENVYVEKNNLITNINNHAFPLIRYIQGDSVNIISPLAICKCGCSSPSISSIRGRIRQSFNIDGIEINAYLLSEIMQIVNNQFNGMIAKYSFEYSANERILNCYISLRNENESWSDNIICRTAKVLQQRLPVNKGLHINVEKQKIIMPTQKRQLLTLSI